MKPNLYILPIQPVYSISEMAKFLNYKTSDGCRKFLYKLNLPINLVGGKLIIYLTDLQTYTPNLFNSILECNSLRSIQSDQFDLDFAQKSSFINQK